MSMRPLILLSRSFFRILRRARHLTPSNRRSASARVRVRVAFHAFWPGFNLRSFHAAHPYLKLKYDLVECRRRPDVHFLSVFAGGRTQRDVRAIPLPGDGRPTVFYTGERVSDDAGRFDWSISFDQRDDERSLYLPGWVSDLTRLGVTPYVLIRRSARPLPRSLEREPCAYVFRNPVPLREAFFDALCAHMPIVSPGRSRNNHSPIGRSVADKLAFLRRFRFNLAFENEFFPGYLTEKIAHSFVAGSVPIYCGDPLVERTFSPAAFVHVRGEPGFASAIDRIVAIEADPARLDSMRREAPLLDNVMPDYATHDCAMAFFERIFDDAVAR